MIFSEYQMSDETEVTAIRTGEYQPGESLSFQRAPAADSVRPVLPCGGSAQP